MDAPPSKATGCETRPFWLTLADYGDAVALLDPKQGVAITYAELERLADAVAADLHCHQKRLVLLLCGPGVGAVACLLGILRAGHAVQLISHRLSDSDLAAWIDAFNPHFILAPYGQLQKRERPPHPLAAPVGYECEKIESLTQVHPDLRLLLTTSGSTGRPCAVRLSETAVAASAVQVRQGLELQPSDCAFLILPMSHVYGLSVLTSHLATGASVALAGCSILDPAFGPLAKSACATSLAGVAFTFEQANKLGWTRAGFDQFRTFTHSGDLLPLHLVDWMASNTAERHARFFKMYGMTEACGRVSILPSEQVRSCPMSVGRAVRDGRIEILPDGEIVFSGPNVMMGYARSGADLMLGDQVGHRLATGDIGRIQDGNLLLTGRKKNLVKILGSRFELHDVAACFDHIGPAIASELDGVVTVFVEAPEGQAVISKLAAAAKRTGLPPRRLTVRCVHALTRGDNGKLISSLPENAPPHWAYQVF